MQIRIKRGLDLALAGAPEQSIDRAPRVSRVALVGPDYQFLKPSMSVEVGDSVGAGQTLFTHRMYPDIRYTAPGAGRVVAIRRGEKRRLLSVVIALDSDEPASFPGYSSERLAKPTPAKIREALLVSGLWPAFRNRSFGAVPSPEQSPLAILVTAIDSNPLAADPEVVIGARKDYFARGIGLVSQLTSGTTFVCKRQGSQIVVPPLETVAGVEFSGPHPSGLPGTHAHYLLPMTAPDALWQIGYQDVISVGELFATGQLSQERVISLAGPAVARPRLLRTRAGSSLDELLAGEIASGARVISGSVLSGRAVSESTAYLGRYHTQVSVLEPAAGSQQVAARSSGGMVCVEAFERIWPLRTPVLPLLRALLTGDSEAAEMLGCLGLHEEDLALCSYVCPAGKDYGTALRTILRELARDG